MQTEESLKPRHLELDRQETCMSQIQPPVLCALLNVILYVWSLCCMEETIPVAQFLQALLSMKRFIVSWLGGVARP